MLRDMNFFRRKNRDVEEPENIDVNVNAKLNEPSVVADSSARPPLNAINEPAQNLGFKATKIDRTPPEKARNRYGWGNEGKVVNEAKNVNVNGNGNGNGNVNTPRSCRTIGRGVSSSGYSDVNSAQNTPTKSVNTHTQTYSNTPTKSVNKPPNPGSFRPPTGGGSVRRLQNTGMAVNTVEVPHFELKEDPSFWMDRNVQVLIRIRPLNNMELSTQGYNRCLKQESAQSLTFLGHPESRFTFDHVACESIDQETLFRMAGLPMVENCLSGYNSCIFAYGQTGSGKTHTMLGEINEVEVKPSPYRGMTPRMFEFLFARIIAEEESRVDERLAYTCKCSFLEIYNEHITDLLDPSSTNLQLREDVKKGVYVENLTEFEVHTVGDILRLLSQGSLNRKVAATNMNRESSRSHCVFTCVIESRWEKDSTSNLRFARLNLVDLAGSERQKTSGAEGERLKEAANINKSLSTLGHVIMVLVDGANAKTRHIPYRDSRLTFLLQDSLGGNSKTMIIANVSPSICSATETLNTLKFAQRAKLIQNNAVVNEDASGDVVALQHQIQLLKEELALVKRQNISRSLTFGPKVTEEAKQEHENDISAITLDHGNKVMRVSSKQIKSLENLLTGALRREQMSDTCIKQFEAEIEQLNRLVRQREEDNKCTKMMLKFREDKIHRMESLVAGKIPADSYLLEENNMLTEEVQMLRAKADRNPEVTRFALENIRLLEQLRRFQDHYEEGERELLLSEVSEMRNKLLLFHDDHIQKEATHENDETSSLQLELEKSQEELEKCRNSLNSCLKKNERLCKEIADLNALLENQKSAEDDGDSIEVIKEPILEASSVGDRSLDTFQKTSASRVNHPEEVMDIQLQDPISEDPPNAQLSYRVLKKTTIPAKYIENVINLQLKVDILETILKEESSARGEIEERALSLSRDLKLTEEKYLLLTNKYSGLNNEIDEAKSVIEALETQQLMSINELEDLRNSSNRYAQELHEKELMIISMKKKILNKKLTDLPPRSYEEEKLSKMQESLEKARRTNKLYKTERECNAMNEEEMDEVRKQVEAETAEVIVCLQEEISSLQQQLHDSSLKETEFKRELVLLQEKLNVMSECNDSLKEKHEEKERQLNTLSEEWHLLTNEIEEVLTTGHEALEDASFDLDDVTVCEKLQMITRNIFEKDSRIKELSSCLEDAKNRGNDMEGMLRSLKGATLAMSEAHQQDCNEKDQVISFLSSDLSEKSCLLVQLNNAIKEREEQIKKASICATGAFVIVNRLSEIKDGCLEALAKKEAELEAMSEAHQQDCNEKDQVISFLSSDLSEKSCLLVQLNNAIKEREEQIKKASVCATGAFVIVNRLSEIKDGCLEALAKKEAELEEMSEAYQQDCNEKDQVISFLSSDLSEKSCLLVQLNNAIKEREEQIKKASVCATGAFVIVNRLSEIKDGCLEALTKKEAELDELKRSHKVQTCRSSRDVSRRDETITLLKKELETAIQSLNGVKTEMARLRSEKEAVRLSEKQTRESLEVLVPQVLALQSVLDHFEKQIEVAMVSLNNKIQNVEEVMQESCTSCLQRRKLYELELMDAKVNALQQAAESSCVYAKFSEAQYTIKEADVMINELLIANETMKLDNEALKKNQLSLKENFEKDTMGMKKQVEELEGMILQIKSLMDEDLLPTASDFFCMKSQIHDSSKLIQSWVEDVSSEIIAKDCELSVMRVCHMGMLSQAVTGLNAENSLIYRALQESSSTVTHLKNENCISRKELEMCRNIQGQLLVDIKNSFDRVSKGEEETGELSVKLASFEKAILNLEVQEEAMVERSNSMGSELSAIVKQMEAMDKSEEIRVLEETFMADMLAKEIELLIVSSEREETVLERNNLEKENKHLKDSILLDKEAEIAFLLKDIEEKEIQMLEKSQMLEMSSCKLQQDLDIKDAELRKVRLHEEKLMADCCAVSRQLGEMKSAVKQCESLSGLSSKECVYLMNTVDIKNNRVLSSLSEKVVSLEQRFEEIKASTEKTHILIEEFESLEKLAKEAISENLNLQSELDRKDKVLEGLQFDLQLLQESSSNKQDQKAEIEELTASVESLEYELDDNIAKIQMLECQLKEKLSIISTLETDVSREHELVKSLFSEIEMLTESVKNALKAKETTDVELVEANKANESLEMELAQMESALFEMKALVESRTNDFNSVSCKRDDFYAELLEVRKELEMAHALSEENEAIATEAKQMAETSRLYAEEKEEEVRVYEKSMEALEHTINVLESQVALLQGEAGKQRLKREELELEFQVFKQEIDSVKSSDSDTRRILNEKEKCLQEVLQRVQILEKEIVSKDSEILQHKAHISELNLHAEAQATEYKQTFKTLEVMADQAKSDGSAQHISNSPSKKLEKNASRTRGSGSPFKCMGMGLVQQMKSERDSELASARQRIEELESLAATRQKEIFALNAKLAMSGSMTHDVLRDLLNIKLDMTTYSSIVENMRTYNAEGQSKDEEVIKLKQQLKEFVIERKGWMDEIERKQSEMIAAEIALEQLRQRDHILATENEMFKKEIANHKMKVIKLEGEVTKLSGQQNLQQRIHHHAKIKEENNALKSQNDELSRKLRRNDAILIRVKEELAKERAASGKNSYYVETELQLEEKLKEAEDERDRLAQKLAALCTSILKAAGVTGSPCDVSVSMAEEALEQFQTRVATLAREVQDLQYKNRISNERVRLLEMMPQMADESQQTNSRSTRSPFLSTLDR